MNKCKLIMEDNKIIKLTFENGENFEFDIKNKTIDVSRLISYISDFNEKIDMDNSQVKQLIKEEKLEQDEINAISFIIKVCGSFNKSFDEVLAE